jgi:hypothetical protein
MKIKTAILSGFLNKSKMSDEQEIKECILDFGKDGLKINANDPAKQARSMAWLKTTAFENYEQIDKIGMNDLNTIVKVLDRFGEKITLKKEGNLLTISGEGKKVDIELVSETFLDTDTGEPKLEFEDIFTITSNQLSSIIKDVQLNKDAIITITTEDKKVKFSNTGKYKFVNELQANTCKGGVNVKLGKPFINAVAQLDNNLDLSVKTDYPVKIMEKTDNSVITIIVAPRVESE